MAAYADFECRLVVSRVDPANVEQIRKRLREFIDGPNFESLVSGLRVSAEHAESGPKPKSPSIDFKLGLTTGVAGDVRAEAFLIIKLK